MKQKLPEKWNKPLIKRLGVKLHQLPYGRAGMERSGSDEKAKNDFVIASLFIDVHSGVDCLGEQYYSNELKTN